MYLPEIFKKFKESYPDLLDAYEKVGDLSSKAGPLDRRTQHLIQLGVSIGLASRGGVRSHARRALEAGATEEEVLQAVLISSTIVGFPSMIASFGWVREVLAAKNEEPIPGS